MIEPDFLYRFDDLQNRLTVAWVTNQSQQSFRVAVDDSQLLPLEYESLPALLADLVDLAVAVHVADRLSIRRNEKSCHIHVVLPVRCPSLLLRPEVLQQLYALLYWYTEDTWTFEFTQRLGPGRPIEIQGRLPLYNTSTLPSEVALWSGGLDSLAGLCFRARAYPTQRFVLFGTGSNTHVLSVQRKLHRALRPRLPLEEDISLVQVEFGLSETAGMRKHRALRARGFVFLLLGAVCARVQGQATLHVYENGVGAINLPFRDSEVGLDHARSVHPLSLYKMGCLVSMLLDVSFSFRNPFLFSTKAEMCQVFSDPSWADLVASSLTCDQRHRGKYMQCGWCSSCILRRQSLRANQIVDKTCYVVPHNEGRQPRANFELHMGAMMRQVENLRSLLQHSEPWSRFTVRYPILWEIVQETAPAEGLTQQAMADRLIQLYSRYVAEWEQIIDRSGNGRVTASELIAIL